jgi:hypothetical protein
MPRPQFTIRTLLWLTLVVAAFLGGMAVQRQIDKPLAVHSFFDPEGGEHQVMEMRDGTEWLRTVHSSVEETSD